jgi:carbohydrate kinase (thermoresistant glucokinase family)
VTIIVMGPSGAGKTTVGRALAAALGWRFIEADDLHTPQNIAKMRAGIGLTHVDRMPWLSAVRREIDAADRAGESVVIACSALTNDYRAMLSADAADVRFVYLHADATLLERRLRERTRHFAGPGLLSSQLATLEDPGPHALTLDAGQPVDALVLDIRSTWQL